MEYYYGVSNGSSLEHFGIKMRSGRYKWGSGDRPYQRLEGRKSRRQQVIDRKASEAAAKIYSSRENVENRIRQNGDYNQKVQAIKDKGNTIEDTKKKMEYIYENRKYYSNQEIRDVISRNMAEQDLARELSKMKPVKKSRFKKFLEFTERFSRDAKRTIAIAEDGAIYYNKTAKLYNAIFSEQIGNSEMKAAKLIPGYDTNRSRKKKKKR